MSDWFSIECSNGCSDPAIHTTEGDECVTNCPTCDTIEREDSDSCELCNA
jgi:hypothetical protein